MSDNGYVASRKTADRGCQVKVCDVARVGLLAPSPPHPLGTFRASDRGQRTTTAAVRASRSSSASEITPARTSRMHFEARLLFSLIARWGQNGWLGHIRTISATIVAAASGNSAVRELSYRAFPPSACFERIAG